MSSSVKKVKIHYLDPDTLSIYIYGHCNNIEGPHVVHESSSSYLNNKAPTINVVILIHGPREGN